MFNLLLLAIVHTLRSTQLHSPLFVLALLGVVGSSRLIGLSVPNVAL